MPNAEADAIPVFSASVSWRPSPVGQGAGGLGHVPSTASRKGSENIDSNPKTIASPAMKNTIDVTVRPWL